MRQHIVWSAVASLVVATGISLSGQSPKAGAAWSVPRLADGHPDMQGVWANNTVTPLERPEVWKDKKTLSEAEIKELQAVAAQIYDNDGDAQFRSEEHTSELQSH